MLCEDITQRGLDPTLEDKFRATIIYRHSSTRCTFAFFPNYQQFVHSIIRCSRECLEYLLIFYTGNLHSGSFNFSVVVGY